MRTRRAGVIVLRQLQPPTGAKLRGRSFTRSKFTGVLPSSISRLSRLVSLKLARSPVDQSSLDAVMSITFLSFLELNSCLARGTVTIPTAITGMTKLTGLLLKASVLRGTFPEFLGSLTALSDLSLERNRLEGTLPAAISNLSRLTSLCGRPSLARGCLRDLCPVASAFLQGVGL